MGIDQGRHRPIIDHLHALVSGRFCQHVLGHQSIGAVPVIESIDSLEVTGLIIYFHLRLKKPSCPAGLELADHHIFVHLPFHWLLSLHYPEPRLCQPKGGWNQRYATKGATW